jgi:D-serine dehydratase
VSDHVIVPTSARLDLREVMSEPVDWRFKGFPPLAQPPSIAEVAEAGWNALSGELSPPVLLLKESALHSNIAVMADYCARHQVSLAPHAKTPVSPQIANLQLAAGAWGLTVASFHQARLFRRLGAGRLLLANELVDLTALRWLAVELSQDPGFEFFCLVDSVAAVELMDDCLSDAGFQGEITVLLEIGAEGGRCGCRSIEEALAVAQRIRAVRHLSLVGVETYENVFPDQSQAAALRLVDDLLDRARDLVTELDAGGYFGDPDEILVTAGGSRYFDRVVARLGSGWSSSRPVRVVLRSGSYVTHDLGLHGRSPSLEVGGDGEVAFRQALELWALALARPEPGLAILGFGKRDAAFDRGFPVPFAKVGTAGLESLAPDELEVLALNDQHAHIRVKSTSALAVGDLVGMHVSHPCTSFDKFRLIPLVDDGYRLTGAIRSYL